MTVEPDIVVIRLHLTGVVGPPPTAYASMAVGVEFDPEMAIVFQRFEVLFTE